MSELKAIRERHEDKQRTFDEVAGNCILPSTAHKDRGELLKLIDVEWAHKEERHETHVHLIDWLDCEPDDEYCTVSWMKTIAKDWDADRKALLASEKALREQLEDAHRRTATMLGHKFKHQEKGHQCGWKVLAEAAVSRSKQALEEQGK